VIVRVLQRRVLRLQDHLVPARGEDRRDRRLADVAAPAAPVTRDEIIEGADAVQLHEVKQLLPRIREVLAQVIRDGDALLPQLGRR